MSDLKLPKGVLDLVFSAPFVVSSTRGKEVPKTPLSEVYPICVLLDLLMENLNLTREQYALVDFVEGLAASEDQKQALLYALAAELYRGHLTGGEYDTLRRAWDAFAPGSEVDPLAEGGGTEPV